MAATKQYTWVDGKFIETKDATVPILTHSLQYGSGIFDSLRVYNTSKGPAIFRLQDHIRRFVATARIRHMPLAYNAQQLERATIETVRKNGLKQCYVRPFAFYNDHRIGLTTIGKKVSISISAVEFGNYFENKSAGIRCRVSTYHRVNSLILSPQAKASGNYANAIMASNEAKEAGADEAIFLTGNGYVAEGPGENIFIVKDNALLTPSKEADILIGITRDSVLKIAESMGITTEERMIHREELLTCDEAFFSGTAAELTNIIEIDSLKIGNGKTGPITKMVADEFTQIVGGNREEYMQWLTFIK
jgi:branched-chain amino acid aminotransferase